MNGRACSCTYLLPSTIHLSLLPSCPPLPPHLALPSSSPPSPSPSNPGTFHKVLCWNTITKPAVTSIPSIPSTYLFIAQDAIHILLVSHLISSYLISSHLLPLPPSFPSPCPRCTCWSCTRTTCKTCCYPRAPPRGSWTSRRTPRYAGLMGFRV